ncbi:ATP-binding cassette sub-family A member 6 [Fukomys damarensis]|uniref:ATP-binding cassette sub-family A member 6 n=1 Tax=Fukomys damarensis TaxID=885580 RepID=A0A091D7T2_FUKDA|nr:ATP-binding cassette sub-family A member 6 [Fukomys damarensis]
MSKKQINVYRQTQALLYKNFLKRWRMKRESLLVQQILMELDMQNVQNNLAKDLSEGQKRKLTFGIAILGDPRVLLLDEPTAGLDPFSRHQVWNFLKERRENHVILFSTQFVDEADILADLFRDLDKCSGQDMMSYDISTSTLNEVLMSVEGKSTTKQESDIEDFIQSLNHQNILLEVDDFKNRNGTEGLSYNGAIIVSGKQKVELKGGSSVCSDQDMLRCLGYCPQENVMWPRLTMKEHLEVYAAVKGLRKGVAAIIISRLLNAFKLHEHLDLPVRKLTAGTTRKLCFVLSILGDSPVLLLDEPSTGIDPTGQHQMWQAIQMSVKNTDRAVLLVTHYLAEAEALCDRVAIMVSGKLRYSSCLTYKLPIGDVYPLSQAFHKLEEVKHGFSLEDYSLSQCTLEKVFLELSKEQELGNVDEEVDTTMRWKLLPHSDEP